VDRCSCPTDSLREEPCQTPFPLLSPRSSLLWTLCKNFQLLAQCTRVTGDSDLLAMLPLVCIVQPVFCYLLHMPCLRGSVPLVVSFVAHFTSLLQEYSAFRWHSAVLCLFCMVISVHLHGRNCDLVRSLSWFLACFYLADFPVFSRMFIHHLMRLLVPLMVWIVWASQFARVFLFSVFPKTRVVSFFFSWLLVAPPCHSAKPCVLFFLFLFKSVFFNVQMTGLTNYAFLVRTAHSPRSDFRWVVFSSVSSPLLCSERPLLGGLWTEILHDS